MSVPLLSRGLLPTIFMFLLGIALCGANNSLFRLRRALPFLATCWQRLFESLPPSQSMGQVRCTALYSGSCRRPHAILIQRDCVKGYSLSNYEPVNSSVAVFTPDVIALRSVAQTAAAPTTRIASSKAYSTVVTPSSSLHKARMVSIILIPFANGSSPVIRCISRRVCKCRHLNTKCPASLVTMSWSTQHWPRSRLRSSRRAARPTRQQRPRPEQPASRHTPPW